MFWKHHGADISDQTGNDYFPNGIPVLIDHRWKGERMDAGLSYSR